MPIYFRNYYFIANMLNTTKKKRWGEALYQGLHEKTPWKDSSKKAFHARWYSLKLRVILNWTQYTETVQSALTCSKLTIETLEQNVKDAQC